MGTHGNIDVLYCDVCSQYFEELVVARLVLVSGQIVHRCICHNCMSGLQTKYGIKNTKREVTYDKIGI